MDSDYKVFYAGLKGLTNQEVIDEIYKKMGQYCRLIEEDIPDSAMIFKEKLRILFDKVSIVDPNKIFVYLG